MDRRNAALLVGALPFSSLAQLGDLPVSPTMPVMFLGHGSPMNAITQNRWRAGWQKLGKRFGGDLPMPSAILCISAHWIAAGWKLTGGAAPRTIHDFEGFPRELATFRFDVRGDDELAQSLARQIAGGVSLDWGLDHGAWSVLSPMFPEPAFPVLQLSLAGDRSAVQHFELGKVLRSLRNRGVLIVGSGNVVHNLRATQPVPDELQSRASWAQEFDDWTERCAHGDKSALLHFQARKELRMAHPTLEHFAPLLVVGGAASPDDRCQSINEGFQSATISMRSFVFG